MARMASDTTYRFMGMQEGLSLKVAPMHARLASIDFSRLQELHIRMPLLCHLQVHTVRCEINVVTSTIDGHVRRSLVEQGLDVFVFAAQPARGRS